MGHENETVFGVSFDLFGTLVTVNEVRIAVRAPEENDRLPEVFHDVWSGVADEMFRVRRESTRWLSIGWGRGVEQKNAAEKTGGRS
jgi:hypothetical protein